MALNYQIPFRVLRNRERVLSLLCAVLACIVTADSARAQIYQPTSPAAPFPIWGVDSAAGCHVGEVGWDARGLIPWQEFAQGEYVGHARTPHVPEYRVREGDLIAVYYRRTRDELSRPYELQVGDHIRIESLAGRGAAPTSGTPDSTPVDDNIARELVVQPDGTITVPLV